MMETTPDCVSVMCSVLETPPGILLVLFCAGDYSSGGMLVRLLPRCVVHERAMETTPDCVSFMRLMLETTPARILVLETAPVVSCCFAWHVRNECFAGDYSRCFDKRLETAPTSHV